MILIGHVRGAPAPAIWWAGSPPESSAREARERDSMAVAIDEASKRLVGRSLRGLIDAVSASHGRASLWLVVVCLVAFLPGFFTIPPVDRDEARFAQATKQMLESGDYVDIRFQDESRYKKPVG